MEAMHPPFRDRASAAAVVPLTVPIPDDGTGRSAADYVHAQTFHTPFDEETRELREEAIRRLALGQDAPPELLLGVGNMNHWGAWLVQADTRSEEHTSELQSLMRISYAVFCLKKKNTKKQHEQQQQR